MQLGHQYHMNEITVPGDSEFNLSHSRKVSTDFGRLVPTNLIECYPGEHYKLNSEQLVRLQPMLAPVMHECALDLQFFFVPFRLLWSGWEDFITGDSAAQHPYITGLEDVSTGSLGELLGYTPAKSTFTTIQASAFPLAAYLLIFDEWYRDQNLQPTQFPEDGLVPGDNNTQLSAYLTGNPLPGALQHDYFTSALPFPQKGPDVRIPVFTNGDGRVFLDSDTMGTPQIVRLASDHSATFPSEALETGLGGSLSIGENVVIDPNNTLYIPEEQMGTIRALRLASVLQEWYEKQARGGSRYNETILSHFATNVGDARVNRPEHIGGYTQKIRFSEVLSTASTEIGTDTIPVGYLGGHGISYGDSRVFKYSPKEHGYIMAISRVRPKTSYSQGLNRIMTRSSMFDYMWPSFADIGDQAILRKELYLGLDVAGSDDATTNIADLDETFGYQDRYAELKTGFDTVHGDFRNTLRFWEMSRGFDNLPVLNQEFISAQQADFDRIFAVIDSDVNKILIHVENNVIARRALPVYSLPSL